MSRAIEPRAAEPVLQVKSAFTVVGQEEVNRQEWDDLVIASPDGWLYQTTDWIAFARSTGSINLSFAVRAQSGKLAGVFPLYREDVGPKPLRLRRLYTGLSGPVLSGELSAKARHAAMRLMFANVDAIAQRDVIDIAQVRLTILAPSYLPPLRQDINPLFQFGFTSPLTLQMKTVQPLTRMVNLAKSEEVLLKEMDGDCRAAVRQAMRSQLSFELASSVADMRSYAQIHSGTWSRTGLAPHQLLYFEDMWNRFYPGGHMQVLFALHDGNRVAGVLLHTFKSGAMYWGGCSVQSALALRPNNYLLWQAILWCKRNRCLWFEVGHFYPRPGPSQKEYNIGKYKSQFGVDAFVPLEGQKIYRNWKIVLGQFAREVKRLIGPKK